MKTIFIIFFHNFDMLSLKILLYWTLINHLTQGSGSFRRLKGKRHPRHKVGRSPPANPGNAGSIALDSAKEEFQDLGAIVEEANEALKAAEAMAMPNLTATNNDFSARDSIQDTIPEVPANVFPDKVACTTDSTCPKPDFASNLANALPLLRKISDAIQENQQHIESSTEETISRNDFPCKIDGVWISNIGGVKLKMVTLGDGKVQVITSATEIPHAGELQNCGWHLSGLVPSRREGPFALAAVCGTQHRIATFVGQCKICGEKEQIFGNWMFSRISRDCSEVMTAVEIKPDVWQKDHLPELKADAQKELAKETDVNHNKHSEGNCVSPHLPPP